MKGYKIDFTASTITITADFAKKMNDPTSAEYKTISQIKKDFPQMKIINKTHKTPRKYVSKSTGETFNCNQFKNLKYENMEGFINGLSNSEDYMKPYLFLKNCGSLPLILLSAVGLWHSSPSSARTPSSISTMRLR